jgi:pyochelin synthetase
MTNVRDASQLLASLEAVGVSLWLDNAQLRYRAPKGVMTPQRLAELRAHRDGIIAALAVADNVQIEHDPRGRHEPFPLTDVQTAYLVGRGHGYPYGGVGCHGYGELRFDDVDPARLEKAWSVLVQRHDMLRAVISQDGTQSVLPDPPEYAITLADIRGGPAGDFTAAVERTRAEMDHRVYRPGEWPLFDLRLTIGDDHAILHFSVDFLIADFVSIQLILDELEQQYRGRAELPDLTVTFRDVLLAQRAARDGAAYQRDRAYWLDRIEDIPDRPELPISGTDDAPARFRRLLSVLSRDEWTRLRERSRSAGLTPTGAVLAAYAEVIGRWSRQPRFTLNVTVLNRPAAHPQIRRLVGDFTAVELLAVDARFGRPFRQRAQAIQARLWEDLDHGRYTGIDVVRELRRRDPDRSSLFPIVFTSSVGLNAAADGGPPAEGGLARLVHGISQTPQVWLDCQAMEAGGGLSVNWDVRAGVFPDGLVENMFAAFDRLLRRLAAEDDAWESCCPVAVPAEQLARRPVADLTEAPAALLAERVLEQARIHPGRTAVVTPSRTLTYQELIQVAGSVAEVLDGWGCRPGQLVAVEMDKGWEQIAAVLGILAAGCAYLPIDVGQPRARRDRILADAGARHMLTQSWLDGAARSGVRSAAVDALPAGGREIRPAGGADDLAYVIYTSGSTGAPKGVMVTHRAAWNTVEDVNARFAVGPDDRVFGLANLGFDLSVYDIFGPLSAGGAIVLPDPGRRTDPAHWAELMDAHGVTLWNSVPSQLEMLMAYLRTDAAIELRALRLALLSGDWIPVPLPAAVWNRLPGLRLVGLGGATEASIWSILHPISTVDENAPSIPYGRPLARQTVEVLGDALAPVPDLVAGELYIGGAGLSAGYLGDPERTAERFIRHPRGHRLYRTGDLGRYLPDGSIEFLGREDNQVKIRGHRVELAEVETALAAHPAVGAAAVLAVGQRPEPVRLAAFVEPAARPAADAGISAAGLAETAVGEAAGLRRQVDDVQMLTFARELDATALLQMLAALRHSGLFRGPQDAHPLPEILDRARVAPRHHRLVRRWLRALQDNGLVRQEPATGAFVATCPSDPGAVAEAWRRVAACVPAAEPRTELIDYFQTTAGRLPELLRADLDPLVLLFPEGRTEIHEVAYNGMFLSRYVNRLLVSAACQLARRHPGPEPFRVLEIGSGVGGTSVELIPALARFDVEYVFSDVSEFFLNNARDRFAGYPWVEYRRYDMNEDYRAQGLLPNSVELVVCANVLHYAKDADATLARLRELVRPGGWVLFIEATRDSYQIMTSMEFLFDEGSGEFTDARRAHEQTFLTRDQWLDVLQRSGAEGSCLPERDPITDEMGMHVFAARFKADRVPVRRAELEAHLTGQLPAHMLPSQLQVVDRLPVTGNGKVDRKALRSWLPAQAGARSAGGAGEPPKGELEEQLGRVWQRLLGVDRVGRQQNFFELGGDSLLAAQLATAVRESLPAAANLYYDNLLRLLLENPTVASLAERITADTARSAPAATAGDGPSPLVELGEGDGPATVLVHDATGGLSGYRPLLDLLGYGVRVAGFQVPEPAAYLDRDPGSLVEDIAGEYARALIAAGHTRLRLVGQHFGGIVAAEVARQLTEVGVRVERLVVVAAPAPAVDDELLAEYLLYRAVGVDPESLGFTAGAQFPDALRTESRAARFARLPQRPWEREFQVFRHSWAAAGLELLPYAGDVTVVRPAADLPPWPALPATMAAYWQDVCLGDLDVIDVPVDYFGCLAEAAPLLSSLLADPAAARGASAGHAGGGT